MSSTTGFHRLGKDGPLVPAIGFGLMGLSSHSYGPPPEDEDRFAILDRAWELGARFWDSSDLYGDNEEFVGKWFQRTGKRDDIFLATKFGFVKGGKAYEVDSSVEYCKKACAESLRVLGVEHIDLCKSNWLHNANPKTPIEETMRAMVELQKEGKIKYIGLSGVSSTTLRRACKIAPVSAIQADYTVFSREIEGPAGSDLLAACRELGVSIVAATPLGRGILTNNFESGKAEFSDTDNRPQYMPRFQGENLNANIELVKRFKSFAEKKGCTIAQLALAWLLKQGEDIIPIPGTKKMKYLEENWGALKVALNDEEEEEIREFGESTGFAGLSAPPKFLEYLYRDTVEEST